MTGPAAAATALVVQRAAADELPLGNLPNWRYPDARVESLDKNLTYTPKTARVGRSAASTMRAG